MKSARRILVSNEFYDQHRGKKDFLLPTLLERAGHAVSVLHSHKLSIGDEIYGYSSAFDLSSVLPGVRIHSYRSIRLIKTRGEKKTAFLIPSPLGYFLNLIKISPDAIIDNIYTTLTPRSLLNSLYCWLFRKKLIMVDPGDDASNKLVLPGERLAFQIASHIVVANPSAARRISEKYRINIDHKLTVQHKIIDTQSLKFHPDKVSRRCTIGYVGRYVANKGFGLFLEIANRKRESSDFIIAGANVDNYSIPEFITDLGPVDHERLAEIYSGIDLLIIPDLAEFKSYPTVAQEASLCGCEIWIGNLDSSYIPDSDSFHHFSSNDVSKLLERISLLESTPGSEKTGFRNQISVRMHDRTDPSVLLSSIQKVLDDVSHKSTK